jgi:Domain of unknown function (DUF3854)/Family of unknown function (DUF5906)
MSFSVVQLSPTTPPLVLWQEYCEERGLTHEMLAPVKGELLTLETAAKLVGPGVFAFKRDGGVGAYVFPLAKDTFQARIIYNPALLDAAPAPGDTAKQKKLTKYFKKKDSANYLYIPPHLTDWMVDGANHNLLIVEGVLNAVRLAAAGFHAVAITGVFNYRVGNKTTPIIPELTRLAQSRSVERLTILFDSDTGDQEAKRELWNGINALAQDLMRLRPDRKDSVYICRPPPRANGEKNGPDDYLHQTGIDEFNRLLREESICYDNHPYYKIEQLYLSRYIYDQLSGQFWDCDIRRLIQVGQVNLELMTFGLVDDIMSMRPMRIAYSVDRGMKTGNTRKARGLMFNPGTEDQFFKDESVTPSEYRINTFNPDDVPPSMKGDYSLFYEALNSICRDSPSAVSKIVTIAAYHAQHPDLTPKYGILLTGGTGCGKSTVAKLIGLALSKKFTDVDVNLDSDFNDTWRGFACKEWPEFNKSMDGEQLKNLITGASYEVNTKYGSKRSERNHTLNIFTCNGLQSKIQEGDRRFIIGGYGVADNKVMGLELERQTSGLLPNYLRYHLINEIDASGYDMLDINTEMRDRVIDASKSYKATVKDLIVEQLEEVPELECPHNEIYNFLLEPHKVNFIAFRKENAQYFTSPGKAVVKVNGMTTKFTAFKNHQKWAHEMDTAKYREQYELGIKLMAKLAPGRKF